MNRLQPEDDFVYFSTLAEYRNKKTGLMYINKYFSSVCMVTHHSSPCSQFLGTSWMLNQYVYIVITMKVQVAFTKH